MEITQVMAIAALLMILLIGISYDSQKRNYAIMLVIIVIAYLLYRKIEERRGK